MSCPPAGIAVAVARRVAAPTHPPRRRPAMGTLFRDARHALRLLMRNPGFSVAAILLLAIGIGANTAVFTLTDSVLLRPLPVTRPHELALLRWYSTMDALPDSISGYFDMGGNG